VLKTIGSKYIKNESVHIFNKTDFIVIPRFLINSNSLISSKMIIAKRNINEVENEAYLK
jgi:hypothetical protein